MTRRNYYLTTDGLLKRKENTVYFLNKDSKRPLPINKIYSIYAYGALSISSQVLNLLSREGIPVHFSIAMDSTPVASTPVKPCYPGTSSLNRLNTSWTMRGEWNLQNHS